MHTSPTVREAPFATLVPLIEEALHAGRSVRFTASGGSMVPFIGHGETVELAPVRHRRVVEGDVVLARTEPGAYVLHRVALVRGRSLYLQGDAQRRPVGPIGPSAVLGVAVATYRAGRRIALDHGMARTAGYVWMRLAPVRPLLIRAVRTGKAMVGRGRGERQAETP